MRTFAQKQNQPQERVSSTLTRSNTATSRQNFQPHTVLHLLRALGNQAVQRLLQANAEEIEGGTTGTASPHFAHDFSLLPTATNMPLEIQTSRTVRAREDVYEQEADRVSEQVISMPEMQLQRACTCGGECPQCQTAQPGKEHERLQTKRVGSSDLEQTNALPIVHDVLSSPGQPLDMAARVFIEPRFGYDFSRVRVHTDEKAAESAQTLRHGPTGWAGISSSPKANTAPTWRRADACWRTSWRTSYSRSRRAVRPSSSRASSNHSQRGSARRSRS